MANKRVKDGSNDKFPLLGLQNRGRWWLQSWKWKTIASWQESNVKPRQCLESRDITLLTKVCIVKAMVFPVIMYDCESWTIKKAEHQKIEAFKLWCWRRLLKARTARSSNLAVNLKGDQPGIFMEGLMLKLKLQYFGHLMWTDDLLEKSLMLGKIEGRRRRRASEDEMAGQHHWCNELELGETLGDGEGQGGLACCCPLSRKESETTGRLNNNNNNNIAPWMS